MIGSWGGPANVVSLDGATVGTSPPKIDRNMGSQESMKIGTMAGCDRELDLRGLACPLPVLKARKALLGLAPGARLRVEADDPLAVIDIPHFCREAGHALLATEKRGEAWVFLIERGAQPPPG